MKSWFPVFSIPIAILFFISLHGCDDSVETYDYSISWTMDNQSPGSNSVFLASTDSEPDELILAVDLNTISNGSVHGAYFDLVFRDEVLFFDDILDGNVLEPAGSVVYNAALDPQDPGRLIVGVSLLGDTIVTDASGVLVFVRFLPLRSGTCPVGFENARILTADNGGTYPVTGISWYGGYATVLE
ncbi:hypothetical protein JW823_09515 [bacterium]|nr:hypothetical protein [candidate division CSSED10-310 bacterium]